MFPRTVPILAMAALVLGSPSLQAAKVIYLLGNEFSLTEGNEVIVDLFEGRGDEIEFWDNSLLQTSLPEDALAAADAADLVFIDESISSARADVLFDTKTPVINNEPFAFDNWGMTSVPIAHGSPNRPNNEGLSLEGGTSFRTDIEIVDPTHPIAARAGVSGIVQILDEVGGRVNWGRPANTADIVAQLPGFEMYQPASPIFVYEAGSRLLDGTTAPGMRIGFFLSDTNRGPEPDDPDEPDAASDNSWEGREATLLTEAGLKLLNATIDYALGLTNVLSGDFNGNNMLDLDDIDMLTKEVASNMNNPLFDVKPDGLVNQDDINTWVKELKRTWIGDANLDGEFSSQDFVAVFLLGKFEADEPAVWSEGDWTGDGRFSSSDFIAAFLDGGFELGPVAATQAVPEPTSGALWIIAMSAACAAVRRRMRV